MAKCFLGTTLEDACPVGCRISDVTHDLEVDCIAKDKLIAFLHGRVTFAVGISAFLQSHHKILEKFIWESEEYLELVNYYLYISEPAQVREIVESLSNHTLSYLFRTDFSNYLVTRNEHRKNKAVRNMFDIRSFRYWTYINFEKICSLIVYFVRELDKPEFACQFLVILPSHVVSNLRQFTSLSPEEEKSLYTALGDSIYELPIVTPKIFDHMIQLFTDDPEIFLILSSMEELIRRQQMILEVSERLESYISSHQIIISIQHIFSELSGLDPNVSIEILNQLVEKKSISMSQKSLILDFLKSGKVDLLRSL